MQVAITRAKLVRPGPTRPTPGYATECTPIDVVSLICLSMTPFHHQAPMIMYTHPIADNLPIKTLVARRLHTYIHAHIHTYIQMYIHTMSYIHT